MAILKNGGRGEQRAADGGAIFPALSPTIYPNSGSSTETEDVEEEKFWLIDNDSNYGNNKVGISFSSSDSRGNGYGGGVGVSGGSLSLLLSASSSSSLQSSSSSSSSSSLSSGLIKSEIRRPPLSVKSSNKIAIKEESIEDVDEVEGGAWGYSYGCNRSFSSSTHADFAKPMEGLHETGPPPFLKKTFEMVDDPESDPIVSWNQGRDGFIVWDCHELSKNLLPKYFKHSNFSSFIRQLNTYGFRKIDTDRWEFANEGFLGGKKHLLKTIKRRSRFNKQQLMAITSLDLAKSGVGGELETLKKDQTKLKVKILKLRQEHEESQNRLTAVKERIRGAECKQQQILSFLIKMAKTPSFVHQLMQKRVRKNGLDCNEFCKRRRLLSPGDLEILTETSTNAFQSVECNNLVEKELNTSQSDLTDMFLEPEVLHPQETPLQSFIDDKSCSFLQGQRANMVSIANNVDSSSAYRMMSDNLLGGNPIVESELTGNDFKFFLELEDLVRKPHDWGGYISSHMA